MFRERWRHHFCGIDLNKVHPYTRVRIKNIFSKTLDSSINMIVRVARSLGSLLSLCWVFFFVATISNAALTTNDEMVYRYGQNSMALPVKMCAPRTCFIAPSLIKTHLDFRLTRHDLVIMGNLFCILAAQIVEMIPLSTCNLQGHRSNI